MPKHRRRSSRSKGSRRRSSESNDDDDISSLRQYLLSIVDLIFQSPGGLDTYFATCGTVRHSKYDNAWKVIVYADENVEMHVATLRYDEKYEGNKANKCKKSKFRSRPKTQRPPEELVKALLMYHTLKRFIADCCKESVGSETMTIRINDGDTYKLPHNILREEESLNRLLSVSKGKPDGIWQLDQYKGWLVEDLVLAAHTQPNGLMAQISEMVGSNEGSLSARASEDKEKKVSAAPISEVSSRNESLLPESTKSPESTKQAALATSSSSSKREKDSSETNNEQSVVITDSASVLKESAQLIGGDTSTAKSFDMKVDSGAELSSQVTKESEQESAELSQEDHVEHQVFNPRKAEKKGATAKEPKKEGVSTTLPTIGDAFSGISGDAEGPECQPPCQFSKIEPGLECGNSNSQELKETFSAEMSVARAALPSNDDHSSSDERASCFQETDEESILPMKPAADSYKRKSQEADFDDCVGEAPTKKQKGTFSSNGKCDEASQKHSNNKPHVNGNGRNDMDWNGNGSLHELPVVSPARVPPPSPQPQEASSESFHVSSDEEEKDETKLLKEQDSEIKSHNSLPYSNDKHPSSRLTSTSTYMALMEAGEEENAQENFPSNQMQQKPSETSVHQAVLEHPATYSQQPETKTQERRRSSRLHPALNNEEYLHVDKSTDTMSKTSTPLPLPRQDRSTDRCEQSDQMQTGRRRSSRLHLKVEIEDGDGSTNLEDNHYETVLSRGGASRPVHTDHHHDSSCSPLLISDSTISAPRRSSRRKENEAESEEPVQSHLLPASDGSEAYEGSSNFESTSESRDQGMGTSRSEKRIASCEPETQAMMLESHTDSSSAKANKYVQSGPESLRRSKRSRTVKTMGDEWEESSPRSVREEREKRQMERLAKSGAKPSDAAEINPLQLSKAVATQPERMTLRTRIPKATSEDVLSRLLCNNVETKYFQVRIKLGGLHSSERLDAIVPPFCQGVSRKRRQRDADALSPLQPARKYPLRERRVRLERLNYEESEDSENTEGHDLMMEATSNEGDRSIQHAMSPLSAANKLSVLKLTQEYEATSCSKYDTCLPLEKGSNTDDDCAKEAVVSFLAELEAIELGEPLEENADIIAEQQAQTRSLRLMEGRRSQEQNLRNKEKEEADRRANLKLQEGFMKKSMKAPDLRDVEYAAISDRCLVLESLSRRRRGFTIQGIEHCPCLSRDSFDEIEGGESSCRLCTNADEAEASIPAAPTKSMMPGYRTIDVDSPSFLRRYDEENDTDDDGGRQGPSGLADKAETRRSTRRFKVDPLKRDNTILRLREIRHSIDFVQEYNKGFMQ